jgi:hypothetical protein
MKRSQRGAAKVSVLWTILIMVAFLVATVMFVLTNQEAARERERAAAAEAAKKEVDAKYTAELQQMQALSTAVGFYDPAQSQTRTELSALELGMKSLRETFPDIDPSIKSIDKALPLVIQAYNTQKNKVKDLETQIASLREENQTVAKNMREVSDQSSKELQALRSQISDLEQSKTDMQADLERQLAEARDSFKDRDAKWRASQGMIEDNNRKFAAEAQALKGRLSEQSRKLNPFVKEPEAADGQVLGVSRDLGLGWISLGAKHRLPVGTRFRVVSGAHGSSQVKAWAEVTSVEPSMAEVRFFDQRDPFDPPVAGDIVFNPLYDPTGERHAVLVGRFSGAFNEKDLRMLLANMSISVQDKLDKATDFLIVGSQMYVDENGQPLAEPVQPSDLPIYKDAVAEGVQIVQLDDLRQYFRY